MPKLKNIPPKLCRIKATNTAVVYVNNRRVVMGPWGSQKSLREYARFLAEWTKAEIKEDVRAKKKEVTTTTLVAAFLRWAKPTVDPSDFGNYKTASKAVVRLYRDIPVSEFGPVALASVQEKFVVAGYSRGHCNKLTNLKRLQDTVHRT